MFSIAAWNINHIPKQKEVQEAVKSNNLSICAVLETHILQSKLSNICSKVFVKWKWLSNAQKCSRGTHIIVGWDPDMVDIGIIDLSDQVIHCNVNIIRENKQMLRSFVYAGNKHDHRRELWSNLKRH